MSRCSVCFVSLSSYGYFASDAGVTGGGAERQLYLLSQELKADFDVHFVVGDYGQPRRERRDGVALHRSYSPEDDNTYSVRLAKLFTAMQRADADLYVYRGYPRKACVTYLLARLLGRKWVYNLASDSNVDDGPKLLSLPFRLAFARAIRNGNGIIAQTPYQKRRLDEEYGVPATVVPNGYPPAESTLAHDDREYFVWIGRLDGEQKRPHLYLDLAERVPDATFLLVGPSDDDEEYAETVRQRASRADNVRYLGAVPPDEIYRYYRNAIALVNTSRYEGFPNTFLEAWRYETPVVSLAVDPGRFAELDGDDYYADGELDELVTIVERLVTDHALRREWGSRANEYFRENLQIQSIARRYGSVLRTVATEGEGPNRVETSRRDNS